MTNRGFVAPTISAVSSSWSRVILSATMRTMRHQTRRARRRRSPAMREGMTITTSCDASCDACPSGCCNACPQQRRCASRVAAATRLRKWLPQRVPPATVAPFNAVDAVTERAWAFACGLGFIGKSGRFISRSLGTYTVLDGLLTDIDLVQGAPAPVRIADGCGRCTRCIDADTPLSRRPGGDNVV